jgi:tungstate transport system substrate-binding protein
MNRFVPICRNFLSAFCAALIVFLYFSGNLFPQEYRQIVVATGSPYELGLVDALANAFRSKYGGIVRCIKAPTGPGLDLGRNGLVHITMGHEKEATDQFEQEGNVAQRVQLMHNYTVVVGPHEDPAGIAGLSDLREVHRRIYRSGAPYLSRGDGGGMHMLERRIWQDLGLDPRGESWYAESGTFMLETLRKAAESGRYNMLDSSTWTMYAKEAKNLKLLVTGPSNRYEMCLVNPEKHPNLKYNQDLAEKFYAFVAGPEGQKTIAQFGLKEYGAPLYFPDTVQNQK